MTTRLKSEQGFEMIIRQETASDIKAITEVTTAAFRTLPVSNHTEHFIINALRAADALLWVIRTIIKNLVSGIFRT